MNAAATTAPPYATTWTGNGAAPPLIRTRAPGIVPATAIASRCCHTASSESAGMQPRSDLENQQNHDDREHEDDRSSGPGGDASGRGQQLERGGGLDLWLRVRRPGPRALMRRPGPRGLAPRGLRGLRVLGLRVIGLHRLWVRGLRVRGVAASDLGASRLGRRRLGKRWVRQLAAADQPAVAGIGAQRAQGDDDRVQAGTREPLQAEVAEQVVDVAAVDL